MRKNKTKRIITLLNVCLLLLSGFIGYHTVQNNFGSHTESIYAEPLTAKPDTSFKNKALQSNTSLSIYKSVWERNLFNTSLETLSQPQKQIDIDNVTEADKNISIKLVGTVAANVSANRLAVVEYSSGQNIYHEGDTAGSYVIKKILRNNVIITTDNGDRLLALESGLIERGKIVLASSSQVAPKEYSRNRSGGRFRAVELPREEIMTAFDDIERLIQKVGTTPYKFGKLTGFIIDSVSDKSILNKIGLRSHDKILALNDKPIGDKGAFQFFEEISKGKKVTIKYRRRNRTRQIELNPV